MLYFIKFKSTLHSMIDPCGEFYPTFLLGFIYLIVCLFSEQLLSKMATKSPEGPPPTSSIANTIFSRVHNLGSSLAGAGSAATARLRTGFTQVSTQMYSVTSAQTRSKTILLSLGKVLFQI